MRSATRPPSLGVRLSSREDHATHGKQQAPAYRARRRGGSSLRDTRRPGRTPDRCPGVGLTLRRPACFSGEPPRVSAVVGKERYPLVTVNGPATPSPEEVTQILPGLPVPAAALRSRMSEAPPVEGRPAAVTGWLPMLGPVAEPVRTLTVAPTLDAVPWMRKSPDFHLALVIVI